MDNKYNYYPLIAIVILGLGIGLRLLGLSRGMWMDEYAALDIATSNNLIETLKLHDYSPLYFILLRIWANPETSEAALRLFSVIWGVLTIIVTLVWLKPISRTVSLLSAFLVATSPMLLRYSQEIQVYPLMLFFVTCSFYFTHRIISQGANKNWYLFLLLALSATVLTHMTGIMIMACICAYILQEFVQQKLNLRWGLLITAIFVPVIVFTISYLLFAADGKNESWWIPQPTIALVISEFNYLFGGQALFEPGKALLASGLIEGHIYPAILIKLILIYCFGCLAIFGDWRRSWVHLSVAGIYWLEILLVSLLFVPILISRTIMPALIPMIIFIAWQATTIKRKTIRFTTIMGLVLLGLVSALGWGLTEGQKPRERWNHIGQDMELVYQQGDIVVYYPSYIEGPSRYYFPSLQDKHTTALAIGADISTVTANLNNLLTDEDEAPAASLFLIVCNDWSVAKDSQTHNNILNQVKSLTTHAYPPKEYGHLAVFKYKLRH